MCKDNSTKWMPFPCHSPSDLPWRTINHYQETSFGRIYVQQTGWEIDILGAAPYLLQVAVTYASCIEQPISRLFYALCANYNLIILTTDAVNAFANADAPSIRRWRLRRMVISINLELMLIAPIVFRLNMHFKDTPNHHDFGKNKLIVSSKTSWTWYQQHMNEVYILEYSRGIVFYWIDKLTTLP